MGAHGGQIPCGVAKTILLLEGAVVFLVDDDQAWVAGGGVVGHGLHHAVAARDAMSAMLKAAGEGPTGRFEGLRALKQVADYPARHASTMVVIEATLDAVRDAIARKSPDTRTSLAGAA